MINDLVISQIRQRLEILYQMVDELETSGGGGGQGGTTDYNELTNKPRINNVTLSGNRSLDDIGVSQAISDALTPVQTAISGKVDKVAGKGLSTNDFTNTDKANLQTALSKANAAAPQSTTYTKAQVNTALAAKLNTADVDNALSSTSTNPVQNKVVQAPIARLVDAGAKNLLKITGTSQTINGVTFTANDDGSVTVNGTNTGTGTAAFIFVPNRQAILIPDGDYILSGCPQGGGNDTFDLRWFRYSPNASAYDTGNGAVIHKSGNTADSNIAIVVKAGKTANNVIFRPMLCTAKDYAISSEYVPYAPSNRELYEEVNTKVSISDIYDVKPTIPNGTDLNTMQTPGAYACGGATLAASLVNCPTTTDAFIMYVDYIAATSRIIQRLYTMNTTNGMCRIYIRGLYSSGWGTWYMFEGTAVT